jgi:hypothetical protein
MGVSGWELAAIIQTPLLIQSSFTSYTMKLLMIFQRKILANFEKMKRMKATSSLPNMRSNNTRFFRTLLHGDEGTLTRRHGDSSSASGSRRGSGGVYQNHVQHYGVDKSRMENYLNGQIRAGETTLSRLSDDVDHPPSYWEAMSTSSTSEIPVS